jgi:hypothetical protein
MTYTVALKLYKAIVLACICCALFLPPILAQNKSKSATAKTVSALVLWQKHVYLGEVKVIVSPNAIRMDGLGKFHFSLIAKAPSWNITVFRTDDRISFTETLAQFCDQGLFSNMVMGQKDRMLQPGGRHSQEKLSGVTVQQVSWQYGIYQSRNDKKFTPPQVENIFLAAYKLPTQGQIPIKYSVKLSGRDWMTNLSEQGQRRSFLSTKKISYEDVPETVFQIPSGLTPVKSVTRIVVGSTKKMNDTGVNVLFDDLGKGELGNVNSR